MVDISYINNQTHDMPEIEEIFENLIMSVIEMEGLDAFCEVSVLFVDNNIIRDMNRDYRNKDTATDVLSFPQYDNVLLEAKDEQHILLGDIVISVERAIEQAEEYGHSLKRELCYLLVHSMFHLFGYDHMTEMDKQEMRTREEMVLNKFDITRN